MVRPYQSYVMQPLRCTCLQHPVEPRGAAVYGHWHEGPVGPSGAMDPSTLESASLAQCVARSRTPGPNVYCTEHAINTSRTCSLSTLPHPTRTFLAFIWHSQLSPLSLILALQIPPLPPFPEAHMQHTSTSTIFYNLYPRPPTPHALSRPTPSHAPRPLTPYASAALAARMAAAIFSAAAANTPSGCTSATRTNPAPPGPKPRPGLSAIPVSATRR